MATGDTVPPMALSSPAPPVLDNSPSNLSSPLSDPEDRDGYGDEADLDMRDGHNTPTRNGVKTAIDSDAASESDDESKLSEVDVNDSEAETERLYDTPPKNGATRDIINTAGEGNRRFTDRRDRLFERSPSKLHQQLRADLDTREDSSRHNSGSDGEDDDERDASLPPSDPEPEPIKETRLRGALLARKSQVVAPNDGPTSHPRRSSGDSRKRKRPSMVEHSELEQPLKKRSGSVTAADRGNTEDVAMVDDDGVSTNPQSGNHTAEEDNEELATAAEAKEEPADTVEEDVAIATRTRKGRRSPTKKQKSKSPEEAKEDAPDEPPEDGDVQSVEIPTPQAEDDHADEADEEAEAAHRNEEESIEKQFTSFRERLYQERLEQLNQEEAMLTSDNPTHPEYLAMLQCLEERRSEKVRRSELELQFKMSVLRRRAVAERSQIMSQFFQAVRELRDETMAELGQEWYQIQQERRRAANTIPDYGIRFPVARGDAVRNAVSYNKEVSVLSGFAKHVGFPAAPAIHGASEDQLEADLEAIQASYGGDATYLSVREPMQRQTSNPGPPFRPEYPGGLASFVQGLGAAGEQFIEQTPWANPNHPSHRMQPQPQPGHREGNPQLALAGPSSGPRRHSGQPGGLFSSSTTTILNGDSPGQVQRTHSPTIGEPSSKRNAAPEPLRREPAVHVS
ncbi:Sds3-like-domain-containing protein [Dichotomopilus funicola]|uniref:Sds3-like-domain-containing protein n=1 Tax=Dichotomopilus funicola TaxID=1934379 RepID=A0AAN6VAG1_9PEZI|nr:Sds3-like-domain-containing protein [Dichotomopilus funicola]